MDTQALKTVGGAVYYTLRRYTEKEITGYDWDYLCGYLSIDKKAIYSVEILSDGFLLSTKSVRCLYHHHEMHGQRDIQITHTSHVEISTDGNN
jgi:hypothetical protein